MQYVVPADEELAQVDEPLRALGPGYQEPESVAMCAAGDGNLKPKTLRLHRIGSAKEEAKELPSIGLQR